MFIGIISLSLYWINAGMPEYIWIWMEKCENCAEYGAVLKKSYDLFKKNMDT